MKIVPSALSSAVALLNSSERQVDVAAGSIGRDLLSESNAVATAADSGVMPVGPGVVSSPGPDSADVADNMVAMMLAQRAFSAALRVMKTSQEMQEEVIRTVR